jgi:phage/plasmid-like protein (TIGR03299 family)
MAHNIYDQRFYTYRQPAWHGLGYVSQDDHSAVEAGEMIGLPEIHEAPIAARADAFYMPIPGYKAIIGVTRHDGTPKATPYTVVTDRYEVVTHRQFTEMFDRATGSRVETLGLLGQGDTLFFTAPISTIDVHGDEVNNYLLIVNPLNGRLAVRVRTTSVRVVCSNTMLIALGQQTDRELRVTHSDGQIARKIEDWLRATWAEIGGMTRVLQDAYDALARRQLLPDAVATALETVYPVPGEPVGLIGAAAEARDKERQHQHGHQQAVLELFEGSRTRTRASMGTAWGLWQAVIEYEDFMRPRSNARSRVFGAGAERKQKAFAHLHDVARL